MGLIDDNLKKIRVRIANACQDFDRQQDEITVVGVCKTVGPEMVRQAWQAGLKHFGENRVQEASVKIPLVNRLVARGGNPIWHMVGHLQTNKVKKAIKLFDIIESVDSLKLAKALSLECANTGTTKKIMLEVNSSEEESKYGLSPDEVISTAKEIDRFENLELIGLMTIGPFTDDVQRIDKAFALTQKLYEQLQDMLGDKINTLSMGMSADFERAIKYGSTELRIGTGIFGSRKYG